MSVGLDLSAIDPDRPLPDGVVWNMRYRAGRAGMAPVRVSSEELWERLAIFLREIVPVAKEAGVVMAAHPDDPPAEALRGAARLVNQPEKYDRLMDIVWFVVLSALIFAIGAAGVMTRRSPLVILLCTELMLNACNLALLSFARMHGSGDGQIFALIVMVVAACEVVIGLGLIVAIYRKRMKIDVDKLTELHG